MSRDGTVETGRAVATKEGTSEFGTDLGPDGTGYLIAHEQSWNPDTTSAIVSAIDLDGMRPGWPIEFDSLSVSHPGFGEDGQVYFAQGQSDWQGEIDAPSRLHSVDRQGRTTWTVELPVALSPEWNGASAVVVPAPPATGSQGTAFVVTDQHDGERTVVYAVDPSGEVSGRWSSPVGLAYAGFCDLRTASGGGCSTGCGQTRVAPVVGDDGTLYFALEDGRVMALGADGRTQAGWPETLRRPGASFWSLATDADKTVFALAIEWEPCRRHTRLRVPACLGDDPRDRSGWVGSRPGHRGRAVDGPQPSASVSGGGAPGSRTPIDRRGDPPPGRPWASGGTPAGERGARGAGGRPRSWKGRRGARRPTHERGLDVGTRAKGQAGGRVEVRYGRPARTAERHLAGWILELAAATVAATWARDLAARDHAGRRLSTNGS